MRSTMRTLIGIVVAAAIGGTALVGASYADGDEGFKGFFQRFPPAGRTPTFEGCAQRLRAGGGGGSDAVALAPIGCPLRRAGAFVRYGIG